MGAQILCRRDNHVQWIPVGHTDDFERLRKHQNEILWAPPIIADFNFTGLPQSLTLPPGLYRFQCWGASGGRPFNWPEHRSHPRGLGGFTEGTLRLTTTTTIWTFVGQAGADHIDDDLGLSGFNGGGFWEDPMGWGRSHQGGNGGGATDIRLTPTPVTDISLTGGDLSLLWDEVISLRSRIMVAPGGGGGGSTCGAAPNPPVVPYQSPGHGGGLQGVPNTNNVPTEGWQCFQAVGGGGTQTRGGIGQFSLRYRRPGSQGAYPDPPIPGVENAVWSLNGRFGAGANARNCGAGGGGGYYGGGSAHCVGAGGGSAFISGHPGCNALNSAGNHSHRPNHFSGLVFTNTRMQSGVNEGNGMINIENLREPGLFLHRENNIVEWRWAV